MSQEDRRGVLERSIDNMTIGVAQSIRGRKAALYDTKTGEWHQQVQTPISGQAGNGWGYVDAPVVFDLALMAAPSQRTVPFENPHFSYGVELTQDSGTLIVVFAHVAQWTVNEFNWTTGATVRCAVQAPLLDGSSSVPYAAVVHMTFQGYGCLPEEQEFQA